MTKVLLFVPTITGSIPVQTVNVLMNLRTEWIELEFASTSRLLIHSARNLALQKMIDWWHDYLMFLDDDNPPTYIDFIQRLISQKKDIIGGVYRQRRDTEKLVIYKWVKDSDTGLIKYEAYKNIKSKRDDVIEVDNLWTWVSLLSRKVCEDMYTKYSGVPFESKRVEYYATQEEQPTWMYYAEATLWNLSSIPADTKDWMKLVSRELSEDLLFFERCKQHWYTIYCDTKVRAYHIWQAPILEV